MSKSFLLKLYARVSIEPYGDVSEIQDTVRNVD